MTKSLVVDEELLRVEEENYAVVPLLSRTSSNGSSYSRERRKSHE